MDKAESEQIKTWFEYHFQKPYDERYHTARSLYDTAWRQGRCIPCQKDWWHFYLYKSRYCTSFTRREAQRNRKIDFVNR